MRSQAPRARRPPGPDRRASAATARRRSRPRPATRTRSAAAGAPDPPARPPCSAARRRPRRRRGPADGRVEAVEDAAQATRDEPVRAVGDSASTTLRSAARTARRARPTPPPCAPRAAHAPPQDRRRATGELPRTVRLSSSTGSARALRSPGPEGRAQLVELLTERGRVVQRRRRQEVGNESPAGCVASSGSRSSALPPSAPHGATADGSGGNVVDEGPHRQMRFQGRRPGEANGEQVGIPAEHEPSARLKIRAGADLWARPLPRMLPTMTASPPRRPRSSLSRRAPRGRVPGALHRLPASLTGSVVSAVALMVLVYQRTGSSLLASLTFALGFTPYLVSGALLSAVVDRIPLRRLLVGCDLACAALVAAMAIPGLPVPACSWRCSRVGTRVEPLGRRARRAPARRSSPRRRTSRPARSSGSPAQSAQIVGNAVGGALLIVLSPRGAILIDAASFLVSAASSGSACGTRAVLDPAERPTLLRDSLQGLRAVFARRPLRGSAARLARPHVRGRARGARGAVCLRPRRPGGAGRLVAGGDPAGVVIGDLVGVWTLSPQTQRRLVGPLAAASSCRSSSSSPTRASRCLAAARALRARGRLQSRLRCAVPPRGAGPAARPRDGDQHLRVDRASGLRLRRRRRLAEIVPPTSRSRSPASPASSSWRSSARVERPRLRGEPANSGAVAQHPPD